MATTPRQRAIREIDYPTGDGKPMAETDLHRDNMIDVIQMLRDHFAKYKDVYVSGNLLMFYVEGDRRRHVSPDVFVVRGVAKKPRDNYLVWMEGKGPDLVIEITSKSTRNEDRRKKWAIYSDILGVTEYFLFDPTADYLKPPLQGFRLVAGKYVPIKPLAGRLPSNVLGLHLEQDGAHLRLFDPRTGTRLLTKEEQTGEAISRAEAERRRALAAEAARQKLGDENDRLRREIERMRRRSDS
jgi:Uma2 family endonuclease